MQKAFIETFKFIFRTVVLVGVPSVVAELVKQKPEWGAYVGLVLVAIDKYIHKLPNEWRGLFPV